MMPRMPDTAATFAAARAQFHRLVELDVAAREDALRSLKLDDAALADAVRALFERLDARDLAPAVAAVPAQLGPFRVLHLIGRGGMGEVYAGERGDGAFEQRVALKLIRAGYAGLGLDGRFQRERQILARLNHPRIAHLIDGGCSAGGQSWLAMEYVDGCDLATWVSRTRADLRRRIALFVRICDAVAFAHRSLIVHRDLKPANVLVDANDEPKLLDFGIAKLIDDESVAQTQTLATGLTLRYAAPEQVLGDRTTTATDVYALGVVLFELIARRSPYRAADAAHAPWRDAILRGDVHALGSVLDESLLDAADARRAARELAPVLRKAMALSPTERYSGVAVLADDLQDWLDGRAFRSGIGTVSARAGVFLRRHRWAVLAGALALSALLLSSLIALYEAAEARRQAAVAEANVDALLGVLSAANPMHYAGRDPTASEFLVTVAAQIRRDHAQDPALLFRALGEIGHGLINLGHADRAEPVLREAMLAADRDPGISHAERLGYLKLLALSINGEDPADLPGARNVADRIERLADEAGPLPRAADALASIAVRLSQLGDGDRATRLFVRAVAGLDDLGAEAATRENIWRQKGWAALRTGDAEGAMRDFAAMRAAIDEAPAEFDPIRVAEASALLAEAALDVGDAASAARHFGGAAPVLFGEYPLPHPARRLPLLIGARLHWLAGDLAAAQAELDAARHPDFPSASKDESAQIAWLDFALRASTGDCPAPPQNPTTPRQRRLATQVQARSPQCAASPR
jgi:serine/threonine-protein kinase